LVLASFASLQFLNLRRAELNRVEVTTQNLQLRMAQNLAAPMWNYAVDQAAIVLETEMRDGDLLAVHVVNAANGVIFVSKMRQGDVIVDAKGDEGFPRTCGSWKERSFGKGRNWDLLPCATPMKN
jgi:hypothetical protein